MPTKYWTVLDGKLGTAHTSRNGKVVDFREAELVLVREGYVELYPPKGQETHPELTKESFKYFGKGIKVPYTVTRTKLGTGEIPNLVVTEVSIEIEGTTFKFNPYSNKNIDSGISTDESIAHHEAYLAAKELKVQQKLEAIKAKEEAQELAADMFLDTVKKAWGTLNRHERRWLKRCIRNRFKSVNQAEAVLNKIDNVGFSGLYARLRTIHQGETHEELRRLLGTVLNIQ